MPRWAATIADNRNRSAGAGEYRGLAVNIVNAFAATLMAGCFGFHQKPRALAQNADGGLNPARGFVVDKLSKAAITFSGSCLGTSRILTLAWLWLGLPFCCLHQ